MTISDLYFLPLPSNLHFSNSKLNDLRTSSGGRLDFTGASLDDTVLCGDASVVAEAVFPKM